MKTWSGSTVASLSERGPLGLLWKERAKVDDAEIVIVSGQDCVCCYYIDGVVDVPY